MSEARTVMARRPSNPGIRRMRYAETVLPSLWFVPALFVIAALVLARVTVALDRGRAATSAPGWLLGGDAGAASALSTTVAAAMLSFSAVVFSTTLVAIQLAGGQYSPRVVRVFVRSRLTQCTLGLFLATFVFAISAVIEDRADRTMPAVTVSVVYLLVIVTIFTFIAFVFGMSRLLRVQYLLQLITRDGRQAFQSAFTGDSAPRQVSPPDMTGGRVLVAARHAGVIEAVDLRGLASTAERRGCAIEFLVEVGEYVGHGTAVARVVPGEADITADQLLDACLLGAERTLTHDPGFALRQLVDVAVRALSPAVNDPTTAVQCIDRITDLLGDVAHQADPSGWVVASDGSPRVRLAVPNWERLADLGYLEIIRYGADSPQVVRRLRAAFDTLARQTAGTRFTAVQRLANALEQTSAHALPEPLAPWGRQADNHGLG